MSASTNTTNVYGAMISCDCILKSCRFSLPIKTSKSKRRVFDFNITILYTIPYIPLLCEKAAIHAGKGMSTIELCEVITSHVLIQPVTAAFGSELE